MVAIVIATKDRFSVGRVDNMMTSTWFVVTCVVVACLAMTLAVADDEEERHGRVRPKMQLSFLTEASPYKE